MAWFKVDDHLYSHPKWINLPKGARALWVTAGAWSAGQLLDGFIPAAALPLLNGTRAEAKRLVESGLWVEAPGGWTLGRIPAHQAIRDGQARERR